jgi:hypothetical protein
MAARARDRQAGRGKENLMRLSFRPRNPFAFLFVSSKREQYLAEYVVREYGRGRTLEDILADPYVRNRSTPTERGRLLERPEVVAAIGDQTAADMKRSLDHGEVRAVAKT